LRGAALLAGCAGARVPAAGNGLSPYPIAGAPQPGDIIHLPTGIPMSFEQMMDIVDAAKVVYVGEMHSNFQAHEAQRRIIEELERRHPGKVAVGMEMFREPQQSVLDRWVRGELTELQFLKESKWFDNWGSDFGNYRGILGLARDRRLDVIALNPPKETQKLFAAAGFGPLPPELAAKVPETDFSDPFQRALLQAVFAGHDAGHKPAAAWDNTEQHWMEAAARQGRLGEAKERMFESFLRTQVLWDESMASRVVDYLKSPAGEGKKMVVIAGGFHVRHGLGVPRRVLRRAAWPQSIVLPAEISIPEELRDELTMDVEAPEIPLIAGDFAWMVAYEDVEKKRVRLGVVLRADEKTVFADKIVPGSAAAAAGIQPGDAFVSIDDFPIAEQGDVILVINTKKGGDTVKVVLRRGGSEVTVTPTLTVPPEMPKQ
ncbi:MAG TPA: ChaN family lipoprotein, partial [Candidatus Methanoperedens sp.]|nr:ChaN family lipoprotein [Candidatus Methanoperedens sp.]